jgi:hypothetical protein
MSSWNEIYCIKKENRMGKIYCPTFPFLHRCERFGYCTLIILNRYIKRHFSRLGFPKNRIQEARNCRIDGIKGPFFRPTYRYLEVLPMSAPLTKITSGTGPAGQFFLAKGIADLYV